jgi:hypothetical protein
MTSTPEEMDIVPQEHPIQVGGKPTRRGTGKPVLVDDNHPFDLENYLSGYTGARARN